MIKFIKCMLGVHPYVKYFESQLGKPDIEYKFCTYCKTSYDFKVVTND